MGAKFDDFTKMFNCNLFMPFFERDGSYNIVKDESVGIFFN